MEKKNYINFLAVLSAFAVVILHTNHFYTSLYYKSYFFKANIVECIFYFAVPIFFMISGVTLIDYNKKYSTKTYFIKRIMKTFIPFLFWSFFGLFYHLVFSKSIDINDLNLLFIVDGILNTKFATVYSFFIPLFLLYLTIPILAKIEEEKRINVYTYIVTIMIIINSLLPFINNVFSLNIDYNLSFIIGSEAVLYALIGYIFSKIEITRKVTISIIFLGIIGVLTHMIGTFILSNNAYKIVETFKGYYNIPCILYSVAIFVLGKQISNIIFKCEYLAKFITFLKNYTFAIYLLHWFVLDLIDNENYIYDINRLLLPFIAILICIIITFIIRKIPILKRLLP